MQYKPKQIILDYCNIWAELSSACFEALNLPYSAQESSEEAPQDKFTDFFRNFPNEFVLISSDLDNGGQLPWYKK